MDSVFEPKYEYDAPQFVDFTEGLQQFDPDADKWFDEKIADEGGVLVEENETEEGTNESVEPVEKINAVLSENPKEETQKSPPRNEVDSVIPVASTESSEPPKKQVPKNVVTSWSDWVSKCSKASNNLEEAKEDNTSTSQVKTSQSQVKTLQSQVKRKQEKKIPERRSARLRTLSTCSNASTCSSVSSSSDGPTARKLPKFKPQMLTIPHTPTFMKRAPQAKTVASQALKSREAAELQVIAQKQKETQEKLKQNKVSMKKALAGQSYMPCRSAVDNLTHPKEFHFATDERLGPSAPHAEEKEKNFFGTLRQHPPSPSFKNKKVTVPVPFKMTESRKRKEPDTDDNPCGEYQSMAQKVYQWQKKTPERFRVKPTQEQNHGPAPASEDKKLTVPKTPNLKSRDRKRAVSSDCLSREEQEKLQEAEMKSYKFKATELNQKIFECNGTLGVYMIPKKPKTEVEPFNFHSEQRAEVYKTKEPASEEEDHPKQIKAQPLPDFRTVFKPELPHQSTNSKPFSFEQRDKELKQKKEEKIKTILDEEKKLHEFHAQPLPSFTPPPLPASSKCLTEPVPFDLSTENRGAVKAEKWGQKLQQEIEDGRMKRVFRARPTNVIYSAPFVPDKSIVKPSTKIEEFTLNSDKRAKEREIYEMHKTQRDLEEEEARIQLEKLREEEEKIHIKQLRKQLVHKPNPIRKYRAVEIKQSDKELTDPRSPEWQSKKRKKLRV